MSVKEIVQKWNDDTFSAADVETFLNAAVEFGNSNEEVQEELEDIGDKLYLFKMEDRDDFWLEFKDGKIAWGKTKDITPTLTYKLKEETCVGILSGKKDSTAAYMKGQLKIEGSLKEGANFVNLLDLLREEMQDSVE